MNVARKYITLLTISCSSILIALCFAEGILWFCDPTRGLPRDGRHEGVRYTWGHRVETNRFNFRERDFLVPKPAHTWRLLALGDSLTWGSGLALSERYTNILENELQSAMPDRKIEVLNFALPGMSTLTQRDTILKYLDTVEPDQIMIGFCVNDPQPREQLWSVEREKYTTSKLYSSIRYLTDLLTTLQLTHLAARIDSAFFRLLEVLDIIPIWSSALDRTYDVHSIEWRDFLQALREIKELSDQKRLPPPIFALLNQALESGTPRDYFSASEHHFMQWYNQAAEAASKSGYTVVEFTAEIRALDPTTSLVVNRVDGHPSAQLNQVYAQKLAKLIAATMRTGH